MNSYYSSYQAFNKNIQMMYNNGAYHFDTDFGNGYGYQKSYQNKLYYAGQQVPVDKKPPYFSLPGSGGYFSDDDDIDTDEEEDDDDDDNLLVMNVINYNN